MNNQSLICSRHSLYSIGFGSCFSMNGSVALFGVFPFFSPALSTTFLNAVRTFALITSFTPSVAFSTSSSPSLSSSLNSSHESAPLFVTMSCAWAVVSPMSASFAISSSIAIAGSFSTLSPIVPASAPTPLFGLGAVAPALSFGRCFSTAVM